MKIPIYNSFDFFFDYCLGEKHCECENTTPFAHNTIIEVLGGKPVVIATKSHLTNHSLYLQE